MTGQMVVPTMTVTVLMLVVPAPGQAVTVGGQRVRVETEVV